MAETWVEIVERAREERSLSQDDLAYEARSHGGPKGLNSAWLSKVKQGERPATVAFLTGIAGALEIDPNEFVEYRLARLRQLLDEREVGFDEAESNLRAIEGLVDEKGLPGPPSGELAQLLRGESPSSKGQQRRRSQGRAA